MQFIRLLTLLNPALHLSDFHFDDITFVSLMVQGDVKADYGRAPYPVIRGSIIALFFAHH